MIFKLTFNENFSNIMIEIGSLATIFTFVITTILYYIFREKQNKILFSIFFICILNFIYAVGILLPIKSFCFVQSFLISFSRTSQIIYGCLICIFNFYNIKIKKNSLKYNYIYRIAFFFLGIIFPMTFSCILMYTNSFGNSGGYCWIDLYNVYKRNFIKKCVLNLFLGLYFVIIINIFFLIKTSIILNKKIYKNETYRHINMYSKLIIISIFPGTINRTYEILYKQKRVSILYFLQIIFENYIGPIINILLIFSPWIRNNILNAIYSHRNNNDSVYPNESLYNRLSSSNIEDNKAMNQKRISVPMKKFSDGLVKKNYLNEIVLLDKKEISYMDE
jgi:hypothetical protein